MIAHVMVRSSRHSGGNATFMLVGRYLTSCLSDYGPAINQLDVTACFRGGGVGNSSLKHSFDRFHSTYLPCLPHVKFFRKKLRIDIEYETALADANFLERRGLPSAEAFGIALREVCASLHLMDRRIKKTDDFDLARFYSDLAGFVANAPSSEEAVRELNDRVACVYEERFAVMDPWKLLDIAWAKFHPNARTLLDDPFFWSLTDACAPHGSDAGADLLSDFRKWNRRHLGDDAHIFVSSMPDHDPVDVDETDDALIAVAFAAIKLRGCCDAATRHMAQSAMDRQQTPAVLVGRGWRDPAERLRTLDILRQALLRAPEQADR